MVHGDMEGSGLHGRICGENTDVKGYQSLACMCPALPPVTACAPTLQVLFVPAGIISCFTRRSDGALFLILYGVTAVYFSGVMVCWWRVPSLTFLPGPS